MATTLGEEQPRPRTILPYAAAALALVLAFIGGVLALNATVYSATSFVHSYLDALVRRDTAHALAMPGVSVPPGVSRFSLEPAALTPMSSFTIDDSVERDGVTTVSVHARFTDAPEMRARFEVTRLTPAWGVFARWAFHHTPVGEVDVSPRGDSRFTVGEVPADTGESPTLRLAVLTPAVVTIQHSSTFLVASPLAVPVSQDQSPVPVELSVGPGPDLIAAVTAQISAVLDECATQQVLQPAGCPFGERISDRLAEPPRWTIAEYPLISLAPGDRPHTWVTAPTPGLARLDTVVRSLFDGSTKPWTSTVPFTVRYEVLFTEAGEPTIVALR